jgi:Ca2+-binding EF-hand superfamily protein
MVNTVAGSGYVVSPYSYAPAVSTTVATSSTSVAANPYAADSYSPQNQNNSGGAADPNAQAGAMKRMAHGIGNAFGRMADWVGLGTISHYAKENFKLYDADKSNNLNTQEFSAVSTLISKSFQEVDSNTNQQISFGEFKRIVGDLVDANFKTLDTSGDGFVNYNEAYAGGYVTNSGPQDSFRRNDRNQDGLLSRNEFAALVNDVRLRRNP